MLAAFQKGDPEAAYTATLHLIQTYQEQTTELGKVRFQVNFGSPLCEDCDGLRAGPGVIATCYQLQQCHYDNVKESGNPRRLRVLQTLLGDEDKD